MSRLRVLLLLLAPALLSGCVVADVGPPYGTAYVAPPPVYVRPAPVYRPYYYGRPYAYHGPRGYYGPPGYRRW